MTLKSAAEKALENTEDVPPIGYVLPEPPIPDDVPEEEYSPEELLQAEGLSEEWLRELGKRKEEERVARCAEHNLPSKVKVAYVIFQDDESGMWGYSSDLDNFADDVVVGRPASDEDVWHGAEYVAGRAQFMLQIGNIVQNVMANLDLRARAMMEQQQNAAIAQQAGLVGGVPLNRQQRRHS